MKGFGTRDFKRASNATICTEIHKWARTHAAFIAYINIQFISPCLQHGITGMFVPFSSSPSPFSPSLFSPNSTLISTYSNALFPPLSLPGAAPSLSFPPTFHSPPFALILYISASASSLHPPPVFPACSVHQSPFFLILCVFFLLFVSLFPPFPSWLASPLTPHPLLFFSGIISFSFLSSFVYFSFLFFFSLFFLSSLIVFPPLFRSSFSFYSHLPAFLPSLFLFFSSSSSISLSFSSYVCFLLVCLISPPRIFLFRLISFLPSFQFTSFLSSHFPLSFPSFLPRLSFSPFLYFPYHFFVPLTQCFIVAQINV